MNDLTRSAIGVIGTGATFGLDGSNDLAGLISGILTSLFMALSAWGKYKNRPR